MVLGFAQCLSVSMNRRTRSSLGIPTRTVVSLVFGIGGSAMIISSRLAVGTEDTGWFWTGIAVLAAAAWTCVVRDNSRTSVFDLSDGSGNRNSDTTDTNVGV